MKLSQLDDSIDVNGQSVYSILDGFGKFTMLASQYLLAEGIGVSGPNGEAAIDPTEWYPLKKWLRAFERINRDVGDQIIFSIGQSILRNARMPTWVMDIHAAAKAGDIAYHMNHRKNGEVMFSPETGKMIEGIGHYSYHRGEGNRIISISDTPYPCDFDRGIVCATVQRFERQAVVTHDPTKPCRKKGGDSCTYVITW